MNENNKYDYNTEFGDEIENLYIQDNLDIISIRKEIKYYRFQINYNSKIAEKCNLNKFDIEKMEKRKCLKRMNIIINKIKLKNELLINKIKRVEEDFNIY